MKRVFVTVVGSISGIVLAANLSGLPKTVVGFEQWTKVAQNLEAGGPHVGASKIVFANAVAAKVWKGKKALPLGSLVVKTAGSVSSPSFVAIMKKTAKGWDYAEYTPANGTYNLIGSGVFCSGCHEGAKAKDYLFSR